MTRPRGDDVRTAHPLGHAHVASAEPDGAGLYLTNEVFLYRVVGLASSEMGAMVELEDCYSLEVARVPIADFHACPLRVVTAGHDTD